jgi:hypothetical protein
MVAKVASMFLEYATDFHMSVDRDQPWICPFAYYALSFAFTAPKNPNIKLCVSEISHAL